MKKVLFIDRDGTIIIEPSDNQIDSLEKLEYYPGVFTWLGRIARDTDYELVMVTNQDGLGTAIFPEETFWPAHNKLLKSLANEGIHFAAIHIDRSMPFENKPTRKPGTGMLTSYLTEEYDLKQSYVIGDRTTDIQLAKNLGTKGILINDSIFSTKLDEQGLTPSCTLITRSWEEIYELVARAGRTATVTRNTRETAIQVQVDLGGSGLSSVSTGLGFFDHMLDQLARHGQLDLRVEVKGDLQIDEHHTIEDTALALGEAFLKALGDKRGIERYGFSLPMDDSFAQVAIDFGGRPWLVWEADFNREKIGEMPTEMFFHFFKSFSEAAKCNLNVKAEGQNEHHKIEAIFKAFAKAIRAAVRKDPANSSRQQKAHYEIYYRVAGYVSAQHSMKVAVIKYNAGNIQSVRYALERLGVEFAVTDNEEEIAKADKVIFPGVGEASTTMAFLKERNFDRLITGLKQPVLGICLGMQLMCRHSDENDTPCLGIFEETVRKFTPTGGIKVPHMGWNSLVDVSGWISRKLESDFVYFVHSYYVPLSNYTIARTQHGVEFSAAMRRDNFYAVQFHPEKSAAAGEEVLKNFLSI